MSERSLKRAAHMRHVAISSDRQRRLFWAETFKHVCVALQGAEKVSPSHILSYTETMQ